MFELEPDVEKIYKTDNDLLEALRELLVILKEDADRLNAGNKERYRVVSACLRVLIADEHPLSTQGLLRYFANEYAFNEPVHDGHDLENFLERRVLFGGRDRNTVGNLSLREFILLSSQNDGLAHESFYRAAKHINKDPEFRNYRRWLLIPEDARRWYVCDTATKLAEYGNRLVKFLETQDLSPKIYWPSKT